MNFRKLSQVLGPGLLYAGAAIGVSHLVQSTKAGATFGFGLIWAVLIANLFKFPFFEMGPRYTAVTGKSLISGYFKIGKWAVYLFITLTLLTMFTIQAAVTAVTAGLAKFLTGIDLSIPVWSAIILLICAAILTVGKYSLLDKAVKGIIIILTISTLFSLIGVFTSGVPEPKVAETFFDIGNSNHLLFLIALMGWMPAPLDISIWHSEWSLAKNNETGKRTSLKNALLDFHIGYWGTTILALCFVSLGALVLYRSGTELSPKGAVFAGQLISMYTDNLGQWSKPIISIAALTTMFSTTLTCLDAFPRLLSKTTHLLKSNDSTPPNRSLYLSFLAFTLIGSILFLFQFMSNMKQMVTLATVLGFLTAPILAFLNMKAMNHPDVPEEGRARGISLVICYLGLLYLMGFGCYYLFTVLK